ncbi:hypothetical protein BDP27DRAFT_1241940, partial [Rhodocollybia butyracea]
KFSHSVSSMKKMMGHNYEDILQFAMPCFEGLFPDDHDDHIQDFLWDFLMFHGFAKF